MEKVAQSVGTWDVLILNAGHLSAPASIVKAPLDDYWKNYEVHFMPTTTSSEPMLTGVRSMSNQL
jgi:NADP-dependent 3-hydroxy acid dehydrogenase YdfG